MPNDVNENDRYIYECFITLSGDKEVGPDSSNKLLRQKLMQHTGVDELTAHRLTCRVISVISDGPVISAQGYLEDVFTAASFAVEDRVELIYRVEIGQFDSLIVLCGCHPGDVLFTVLKPKSADSILDSVTAQGIPLYAYVNDESARSASVMKDRNANAANN